MSVDCVYQILGAKLCFKNSTSSNLARLLDSVFGLKDEKLIESKPT